MDLAVLAAELANDPAGLGYAADVAAGRDATLADKLNAVSTGIVVDRGVIPAYEIINATVPAEWTALSAAERLRYQTLTGAGDVDTKNPNVRAAFLAMFGAGTATRTALAALQTRAGSRAEQLFGPGVAVDHMHVARALGRGN